MTCLAVKLTSFPLARARLNPIARAWLGAGYKAFGVTDFTRTRELVYDPV